MQVALTQAFTATVQNDAGSQGVTWTVSGCGTAVCGTLTNQTTGSVTYNAPATVPNPATNTLTATSKADNTRSQSVVITITPAPGIAVSVSPDAPLVQVTQSQVFTAMVQNDVGTMGVTWSLPCAPVCGTLTGPTSTSVTYNAPATIPAPAANTLTATSVADGTKSKSIVLTVTAVPLFTDNFDRPDANPIGAPWLSPSAAVGAIVDDELTGGVGPGPLNHDNFTFVSTVAPLADGYAKVMFVSTDNDNNQMDSGGPMVRGSANGDGYLFDWISNNPAGSSTWTLFYVKKTVGQFPLLATGTFGRALVKGDVVEIRVIGNVITGYLNGSAVPGATATDTNIATTGVLGMHLFSNTGRWDNFEGGGL